MQEPACEHSFTARAIWRRSFQFQRREGNIALTGGFDSREESLAGTWPEREYLRTLRSHGVIPSVSRPGTPYDNGNCERFFRTLKQEQINTKEYKDLDDLRLHIAEFIDHYYNQLRLHSALIQPSDICRQRSSSG